MNSYFRLSLALLAVLMLLFSDVQAGVEHPEISIAVNVWEDDTTSPAMESPDALPVGVWLRETVDSVGDVGQNTSLELDDDGEITEQQKINSPTDADLERQAKIGIGSYGYLPDKLKTITLINSDDPDPSPSGEPIDVYVHVVGFLSGGGWVNPPGNVTVTTNPGNYSCSIWYPSNEFCSLTIPLPGSYVITTAYQENSSFLASSSWVNHSVRVRTTTTLISDNPDPTMPWQPFTATFSVTSTSGIPAGAVGVTVEGSESTCFGVLNGSLGSCTLSLAWSGEYTLTATYGGDWNSLPSSASALHVVAGPIPETWLYLPWIVSNSE